MSYIAGWVDFSQDRPNTQATEALRPPHARPEETEVHRFSHGSLVRVDIGAFGEPGFATDAEGFVAVAGHPLFDDDRATGTPGGHRGVDRFLDDDGAAGAILRSAHGVFALASWKARSETLTLAADRMGVRPLYWWQRGSRVVFSTVLDVVRDHPWVDAPTDLQGLMERLTLGYALADRTPYQGILRMLPGVALRFAAGGSSEIAWAPEPRPWPGVGRAADEMVEALRAAVGRRLGDEPDYTFLSGGLDSRVVALLLWEADRRVTAVNFGRSDIPDTVFARQFAARVGMEMIETPKAKWNRPDWSQMMADALDERRGRTQRARPPVWSGDGGSVCLGWVYVTPEIMAAMNDGDVERATRIHLDAHGRRPPIRDLTRSGRRRIDGLVEEGMTTAIESARADDDPAAAFFRFLVENDQRRHLDRHFAGLLRHRTEFWLPFFDADCLGVALATPSEYGARHRFYMEWLGRLPEQGTATPWQAYPGHVPCPIAVDDDLQGQWSTTVPPEERWRDPALAREVARHLLRGALPGSLVRRSTVVLRLALHEARVTHYGVPLEWMRDLGRHWRGDA